MAEVRAGCDAPRGRSGLFAVSRIAALLLAAGAVTPAGAKPRPVRAFDGISTAVKPADILPNPSTMDEYNESWEFHAWMEGGWSILARFATTNIGPGKEKLIVEARVASPKGEKLGFHDSFNRGKWSSDSSALHLVAGANVLTSGHDRHVLRVGGEDLQLDLEFRNVIPPWRPGSGDVTFGDSRARKVRAYHIDLIAPRATVRGRVRFPEGSVSIRGIGYAQHTRSTIEGYKMALSWDRFRGFTDEHTILYGRFITTKRYGGESVRWLLVANGDRILMQDVSFDLRRFDLRPDETTRYGYDPPWAWTVRSEGARTRLTGTVTASAMRSVHDFLATMRPIERAVIKGFTRPVEYYQRCEFAFTFKSADAPAVTIAGGTNGCGSTFFN